MKKSYIMILSFVILTVVGCKTTPPTLGYIRPSKEILEAYGKRSSLPYDGAYLDFGQDGGHTTKRVIVGVYDQNGNMLYQGENSGADIIGRISSNAGAFIGTGTIFASPFWGYLASKKGEGDRINISGGSTSLITTSSSSSGP